METEPRLTAVLSDFARTLVTGSSIQDILDHLVVRIVEMLPVTAAGVSLMRPDEPPRFLATSDGTALRYQELQDRLRRGPLPHGLPHRPASRGPRPHCGRPVPVLRPRRSRTGPGGGVQLPVAPRGPLPRCTGPLPLHGGPDGRRGHQRRADPG